MQAAGQRLRGDILAPAFGILAAFPIYRSDWGSMGTIDRRFTSCNSQVRSVPFKPQDKAYRDLEYFLSYMSNGVPITGPGHGHETSDHTRCGIWRSVVRHAGERRYPGRS